MPIRFPADSPLGSFSDEEIEAIFASGAEREIAAGESIANVGEPGESMFILLEGNAEVRLQNGLKVRTYEPGSYFGELSWINPGHLRSADILASTAIRYQELDQESIKTLIESHPNVIFTLLRRTCAFLVDAERSLIGDLRKRNSQLEETIKKLDFTRNRLTQEEETARRDALTGLYNRRALDSELPMFIERAKALGEGLALVALDLDHFKPVNDTLGHAAGDTVLRGVGDAMRNNLRKSDLSCRVGGDEFIFLIADVSEADARECAEKVRAAIGSMPHPGNDQGIRCTGTFGGTLYVEGDTPDSFKNRADEVLYEAKRNGRNQVGWSK
ncbi:MAG: GGDEF domain-containing protein [Kofleriaceae bacterium]|nr:GGDEF domain-containing protein [Kofleriaceae bacterium]